MADATAASLRFSQVPGRPTFRGSAVNTIAMVPLLSADKQGHEIESFSSKSFLSLLDSLRRYSRRDVDEQELQTVDIQPSQSSPSFENSTDAGDNVLLVVPNSQLTRPGDWRYDTTPLKNFHWSHGSQRIQIFDGRPHYNRMAHDRLYNPAVSRNWIDLCPSRRTSGVIGVLNVRDVTCPADLLRAQEELQQWADRYSAPPYEVTFHGRSFARDEVISRLFVFDSFEDDCREMSADLTKSIKQSSLVAFPPLEHDQMMDLHLNVVVNDLAVAIFRQLENKIKESDALSSKEKGGGGPDSRVKTHSLLNVQQQQKQQTDEPVSKGGNLSVANIANVVSPGNKLAASGTSTKTKDNSKQNPLKNMVESAGRAMHVPNRRHAPTPQLLTPLDDVWDLSELNPRDAEAVKRRNVARREKLAADLSLLAGSPMDAYERYSRAAEMCKASPDPLWYACALEGCAAAHIAMAEAGGYNVDAYLEQNFQLPDEFMHMANNIPSQESRKQTSKQTLPAVVFALCEEALHILNRNVKLAPLQAELLLKLGAYVADVDEAHLRCRWGEGEGCYAGDPSDPKRWDRPSVSQLAFQELKGKDGEDLIALNTVTRCQMFTRILHRAASTGALAPLTRADVAATCARLCLRGIVPTQRKNRPKKDRIQMFRKAAFFATVAAESISQCADMESTIQGSEVWLTACQLYSRDGNADGTPNYGWATLRASSLYSLSQQEDKLFSEAASEMLLAVLSEMAPDEMPPDNKVDLRASLKALDEALQFDDPPMSGNSRHSTDSAKDDRSDTESTISLSGRYSSYSKATKTSMAFRNNFFPQQPTAAASLLTVAQAKWAEDEVIPLIDLPLIGSHQKGGILSLNCVLPKIRAQSCAAAQKGCISRISKLRQDMPTISSSSSDNANPHYAFSLHASPDKGEPIVPPPIEIVSASVVPSESHLVLERFKAGSKSVKGGSMATFYNPYEKKKDSDKKIVTTLVAEGEERELTIEFGNRLCVPLDIPSCQIEFDCGDSSRIKAPAISFVIPPKAKRFSVHFPFIVHRSDETIASDKVNDEADDSTETTDMIDVKGLRVTCLGRSYFLLLAKRPEAVNRQVPDPAAIYQRRVQYDANRHEEMVKPRLELLPPQPQLHLKFAASEIDVTDGLVLPVHLSEGETYSLPSFRVSNDFGPTGMGTIERLQFVAVGLPGSPDEVLFDTDTMVEGYDGDKTIFFESFEEDSENKMNSEAGPPLKMKAISDDLSLASINDRLATKSKGSIVRIQMVASHRLHQHIEKTGNVRLRIRYRGTSVDPAAEIWRKTEVKLKIVAIKGPRISSLAFRPGLSWGGVYSNLNRALTKQREEYNTMKEEWKMSSDEARSKRDRTSEENTETQEDTSAVSRVGLDSGVHISSSEVTLVMSVANETDSTIVLSNQKGMVGGFNVCPMPTVRIAPGVSAKVPVVFRRIKRNSYDDGSTSDIIAQLVSQLGLQWETAIDSIAGDSDTQSKERRGRIRIPSSCLREIMDDHPLFLSRVCEPPLSINFNVGRKESEQDLPVSSGSAVDTFVEVKAADWIPMEVAAKCKLTLEFCATRKEGPAESGSFVWCGLIRRTIHFKKEDQSHKARLVFLKAGEYVVSACARLVHEDGNGLGETWWAPVAENIQVENSENVAAQ